MYFATENKNIYWTNYNITYSLEHSYKLKTEHIVESMYSLTFFSLHPGSLLS